MTRATTSNGRSLPIDLPIGNHGDVLLSMKLRYTKDRELRRRVGDDIHTTKRNVGRDKEEAIRKQHVDSFMEATAAAASGCPNAARKALQELVLVHKHDPVSLAGDFAELALSVLREPHRRIEAETELQQRRTKKRLCLALGILSSVVGMGLLLFVQPDYDDPMDYNDSIWSLLPIFLILAGFGLFYFPVSMLKREQEAKKLVDELYLIASNSSTNHNNSDLEKLLPGDTILDDDEG